MRYVNERGRASRPRAWLAVVCAAVLALALPAPAAPSKLPPAGFQLLYELKFADARAQFQAYEKGHPDDPLAPAFEAASYLFEELHRQGVFKSEFFLDDKRFAKGIEGRPDEKRKAAFLSAIARTQELAKKRLQANPKDADALLALTMTSGMLADYTALLEKNGRGSLKHIREARVYGNKLLQVKPDAYDAYVALGSENYILGSLPRYKRVALWFGGMRANKEVGLQQLQKAAANGQYLRPVAKMILTLAALREKRVDLARKQLQELATEFPQNPIFARELKQLPATRAAAGSN